MSESTKFHKAALRVIEVAERELSKEEVARLLGDLIDALGVRRAAVTAETPGR